MLVAVTGASGFLGRHVLKELARRDVDVIASSRHPPVVEENPRRRWVKLDIAASCARPRQLLGSPDILIHLAWDLLPNYRDPLHMVRELPNHVAFLDACLDGGQSRLAISGTCLEYGLAEGRLEEPMQAQPTTAYGEAKHQLHRHMLARCGSSVGLAWFRLFYLYGTGQAVGALIPQLERAVRSGARRFDMSPGDQTRDFTPVEFAAEALVRISLAHANPGTVNICTGRGTRVIDMVRGRLLEMGANIELNTGAFGYPDYEPRDAWGDRRRMDALLEVA